MSVGGSRDGGPAFPVSTRMEYGERGHQDSPDTWQYPGMTLRDYFAGQALAGMYANHEMVREARRLGSEEGVLAHWSYLTADAMIAAREVDDE